MHSRHTTLCHSVAFGCMWNPAVSNLKLFQGKQKRYAIVTTVGNSTIFNILAKFYCVLVVKVGSRKCIGYVVLHSLGPDKTGQCPIGCLKDLVKNRR